MAVYSVGKVLEVVPDVQIMGGDVILHLNSKNEVIGKLLSGDEILLNEIGDSLLQSANTSTSEPVKPAKGKKAKPEGDLNLDDL